MIIVKKAKRYVAIFLVAILSITLTSCGDDYSAKYEKSLSARLDLKIPEKSKFWSRPGEKTFSIEVTLENTSNVPISENLSFYAITRVNGKDKKYEVYKTNNIFDSSFTTFLGRDLLVELNPNENEKMVLEFELPFKRYVLFVSAQNEGVEIDPSRTNEFDFVPSARASICWDSKGVKFGYEEDCPYAQP